MLSKRAEYREKARALHMPSFGTWVKELGLLRPFSMFCIYRVGLENKYHLGLSSVFLRPPKKQAYRSFQGTLTLPRQPQPAKPKQNNFTAKPSRRSFCLHIGHHFDSGEQLTRPSSIYRVSAVTIGCRMESYAARLASFNAAHPTKKRASNASIGKTLKWPHKNPSPPQVRLGSQKRLIAQC